MPSVHTKAILAGALCVAAWCQTGRAQIGPWAILAKSAIALDVKYTYDAAGRLALVDYGNGATIGYTYDNAGNLLSRVTTSTSSASEKNNGKEDKGQQPTPTKKGARKSNPGPVSKEEKHAR